MEENRSVNTDPQSEVAMPQLMDAKDVAKILKMAPKTVHKLVREGKLGCNQVMEKARRFTREQVQEYIDSRTVRTSSRGQSEGTIQHVTDGEPE